MLNSYFYWTLVAVLWVIVIWYAVTEDDEEE